MSIFDLKGGSSTNWNYSNKDGQDYSTTLSGTVVEISNPQAIDFNSRKPKFWPDGNPMRNLRVTVKEPSGRERAWVFTPKSVAAEACLSALDPDGSRPQVNIADLLGKLITISTKDGVYNAKNPRPWDVHINGVGDAGSVRGIVDLSAEAKSVPAPEPEPAALEYEDIPF